MIDHITAALNRKDYQAVSLLLKQLQQQSPDHPWFWLLQGKLQEGIGKSEAAEAIYRQVLRESTHPKVIVQAREGLQRLAAVAEQQRQSAIDKATADPANTGIGFLVLESLTGEARLAAAQHFARIMKIDAYTARLTFPSHGWKLYRTGTVGELQVYGQELRDAGISAFWVALAAIERIRVFRVQWLQSASPQVTVFCQNEADQVGSLSFDWSEVANRVEGRLPIFEEVVDVGAFNQLQRKEQTQDYVQVLDLHLPKRKCILRLCDRTYQFDQGVVFAPAQDGLMTPTQTTNRLRWNRMIEFLDHQLTTVPVWSEFPAFANTALEHLDRVQLAAHIDLLRKAPTNWDPAFHLYSSLVFEVSRAETR